MSDYSPTDVKTVWDNHLTAFGSQDMDKIMLDYDDKSKLTTYNFAGEVKNVYEGVAGICSMLESLFKSLSDASDFSCPYMDVDEEGKMVFVAWKCPSSGFEHCAETLTFSDKCKIVRQNVVFNAPE